jgi:hypothetical protein
VLGFIPTLGQSGVATGYATTWWRIMKQEEGKNHGYTWEFFKERVETEFVPRNSDYISRCKLCDLVNVTNENLTSNLGQMKA